MTFDELEKRARSDERRRARWRRIKDRQRARCKSECLCERCWRPRNDSPSVQYCVDCLLYRREYVRRRIGGISYGERQEGRHPGGRRPLV